MGFDDLAFAGSTSPPLTTIRQHRQRLGSEAAKLLIDMVRRGGEAARAVLVPVELVVRGSCGAERVA